MEGALKSPRPRSQRYEQAKMEEGWFSVWARPSEQPAGLQDAMTKLRGRFEGCPEFEPHVTVLGMQKLPLSRACECLQAACRSLSPYTCRLSRPDCGHTFFQSVYMLLDKTPEVMRTNQQVQSFFGLSKSSEDYMPHLSLLYGDLGNEDKQAAKKLVEEEFPQLSNREFHVSSLVLYSTDTNDKSLQTWRMVAEYPLEGTNAPNEGDHRP